MRPNLVVLTSFDKWKKPETYLSNLVCTVPRTLFGGSQGRLLSEGEGRHKGYWRSKPSVPPSRKRGIIPGSGLEWTSRPSSSTLKEPFTQWTFPRRRWLGLDGETERRINCTRGRGRYGLLNAKRLPWSESERHHRTEEDPYRKEGRNGICG